MLYCGAEPTFFYGGYLSQWHPCKFHVNGVRYNCAEQFMMAQKAYMCGDYTTLEKIMNEPSPKTQKALGRQVSNFDPAAWNVHCEEIVHNGNFAKFDQNPELLDKLLATEGLLVEASPTDKIWGIGLDAKDPNLYDTSRWGENKLGRILTAIRHFFLYG